MAAFTYQGTIQFRRQNAAQWTAANPVLAAGELGLELDTKYFKIGDGTTAWTSLGYGGMSSPAGVTQAAGDNSTLYATTAFVAYATQGIASISISGAHTLTAGEASTQTIIINGTLSANATITVPATGAWNIVNETVGGYSVILTNGGSATMTVTQTDAVKVIACSLGVIPANTIANYPTSSNDNSIATTAFVQNQAYRRNRILNGQFDVWQRGTAWTTPATGTYTADKWRIDYAGTSAGTFTIGQALGGTQPAGLTAALGPNGVYSWNQTVAPNLTSLMLSHRCEGIYTLNGQTCTVSFSIALGAGSQSSFQIGVNLAQCFGTGGSPSATVTQATQYFTVNSSSFTRFTATFTLPATTGTLGSNANDYLALQFVLPTSQTFSFYLAQVQLEAGSAATPYMVQTTQQELLQCLRFYQKTFPTATTPTYNTAIYTSPLTISQGSTGYSQWINWDFDIPLRGVPTVAYYSVGNNATGYWTSLAGTVSAIALPTAKITASGVTVGTPTSITANTTYVIHATADADL